MRESIKCDYERYFRIYFRGGVDYIRIFKSLAMMYVLTGRMESKSGSKLIKMMCSVIHKIIGRKMGNEIYDFDSIGHGLVLTHPYNITVAIGTTIGTDCTLFKGCTVGGIRSGQRAGCPNIGNRVTICCNATVCGGISVGNDVLIASNSFVDFDVPDNSIVIGSPGVIHRKEQASADYL